MVKHQVLLDGTRAEVRLRLGKSLRICIIQLRGEQGKSVSERQSDKRHQS